MLYANPDRRKLAGLIEDIERLRDRLLADEPADAHALADDL